MRMMVERRHQRFRKEPTAIQPEGGSKASGCISVWGGSEGRTAGPADVGDPQPGDAWGARTVEAESGCSQWGGGDVDRGILTLHWRVLWALGIMETNVMSAGEPVDVQLQQKCACGRNWQGGRHWMDQA